MKMGGRLFRRMSVLFPASHSMGKKRATPQFQPNIKLPSAETSPDPSDEERREKVGLPQEETVSVEPARTSDCELELELGVGKRLTGGNAYCNLFSEKYLVYGEFEDSAGSWSRSYT